MSLALLPKALGRPADDTRQVLAQGRRWRLLHWAGEAQGVAKAPLLFLHGFAGLAEAWGPTLAHLPGEEVWALDLPGHGGSFAPPSEAWGLPEAADALEALLGELAGDQAFRVVGYSLGGRLALHLAWRHPQRVAHLALVGASAGLEGQALREARWASDQAWAKRLREEGLAAFAQAWEAQGLFAGLRRLSPEAQAFWRGLRAEGVQSPEGLAASLLAFSPARQLPLQPLLESLAQPTCWLAGAEDSAYALAAQAMAALQPQGHWALVPGSGHALPIEAPEALAQCLLDCWASSDARPSAQPQKGGPA